jgi:hypothetical protein
LEAGQPGLADREPPLPGARLANVLHFAHMKIFVESAPFCAASGAGPLLAAAARKVSFMPHAFVRGRPKMRLALGISVLTLVLASGAPVYAQDVPAEPTPAQIRVAAEAFDKGREAYQADSYVEAAEQFEKADYNAPSAAALELAARSRDKAGQLDRAATLASLGVKRYPEEQNLLKLAGDLAKRARQTLFELTATCDQPCELTVGGKLIHGVPDTQRVLFVAPGTLTIRAGWSDNRNDSRRVDAVAGGNGEVSFTAPEPEAPETAAEPPAPALPPPAEAAPPADEDKKWAGLPKAVFFAGAPRP